MECDIHIHTTKVLRCIDFIFKFFHYLLHVKMHDWNIMNFVVNFNVNYHSKGYRRIIVSENRFTNHAYPLSKLAKVIGQGHVLRPYFIFRKTLWHIRWVWIRLSQYRWTAVDSTICKINVFNVAGFLLAITVFVLWIRLFSLIKIFWFLHLNIIVLVELLEESRSLTIYEVISLTNSEKANHSTEK